MFLKYLLRKRTTRNATALPEPPTEDPRVPAALELERRLYESAVSGVEQTFAKEGLVATFLTSGALVALAASIQAYAEIATSVGKRATWLCIGLFTLSMALFAVSGFMFITVLKGRSVQDLSGAEEFMNTDAPSTLEEAHLKLIAEYRQARENHMDLVKHRMASLMQAIGWLGASMLASFAAVLIAIVSQAIHKNEAPKTLGKSKTSVSRSDQDRRNQTYTKGYGSISGHEAKTEAHPASQTWFRHDHD